MLNKIKKKHLEYTQIYAMTKNILVLSISFFILLNYFSQNSAK